MPFEVALGELDAAVEAACARALRAEAAEHAERLALEAHEHLRDVARLVLAAPDALAAARRRAQRQRHHLAALADQVAAQQAEIAALQQRFSAVS